MTDAVIVSDAYRVPITAERHKDADGGVVIRRPPHTMLILSQSEFDRLVAFVRDEPAKARLQRFPMAPDVDI